MPRGKWVFVTFWATWCGPCVKEMPAFIDFYEKNAAVRRNFEIIAVHSPDGASFAAIQNAYSRLVNVWGKSIPFPLFFDSTGATHKRWGIEAYPTSLLIDPAGRIVGAATLEDLAAKLHIHHET
jgi:thiol-disulfide isomerase/thioredoxin